MNEVEKTLVKQDGRASGELTFTRSRAPNLEGQRFGKLLVLRRVSNRQVKHRTYAQWLCRCDCGREIVTFSSALRSGNTRSCHCLLRKSLSAVKNLKGQRFGKLLVLERSRTGWFCRCDCGNEIVVPRHKLLIGKIDRCRECAKTQLPANRKTAFEYLFTTFCQNAKNQNLRQELSKEKFYELSTQPCYYCGKAPSNVLAPKSAHDTFIYNGINRVDGRIKAYTIDNSVPACKACNYAKHGQTPDYFRELVIKVYNTLVVQKRSPAVYASELLKIPDIELPQSPVRSLVVEWKWRAKQRKKPWSLTNAQAAWLSQQPCFYCGKKPSQLRKKCIHSGLDQIDSEKGYEIGNVVPCCKACNIAKGAMTFDQFRDWVTAVYLHWVLSNIPNNEQVKS